ncbi:sulfocyanin-like copper-binding protein [Nocardia vaccinii]|uniref:sulfocyanin-like copper-binding protein n=1 Tax=Nocardia vaccinii TaxID=1822 RepID=UPI00083578FD|nr:sulfocyanin-like copper-binding protein [Nocardia vaccinii]
MNRTRIVLLVSAAVIAAIVLTGFGVGLMVRGGPGSMMGGDSGTVMGSRLRDAPGPRVDDADAMALGAQIPAGGTVDQGRHALTFTGRDVRLAVLASPSMPAENFRIAGMDNPTVTVPFGAHVTMEVINADGDMAHGLVVTTTRTSSPMPIMMVTPAFAGAALSALGASRPAEMHAQTLTFTADTAGEYRYVCPVPGHIQKGMIGTFIVAPQT